MMKHEFEDMLGQTVTAEAYAKIEYVYANNDFFSNTNGKEEVVNFYKHFDMEGIDQMFWATKKVVDEIETLKKENNRLLEASLLKPEMPAAAVDALNYTIAGLLRKRVTYLEAMSAALDQHDRAEYDRVNALDCALWERISAMQKLLPGA